MAYSSVENDRLNATDAQKKTRDLNTSMTIDSHNIEGITLKYSENWLYKLSLIPKTHAKKYSGSTKSPCDLHTHGMCAPLHITHTHHRHNNTN